ncbi:MAG: NADH-quinone oxidoreductase subunit C [Candidatus Aenigmarchaeota archaeon]|nr:NADH-quinone oxidoreductase subunit C [Candidatus Aenigmarchaeota archaeon]
MHEKEIAGKIGRKTGMKVDITRKRRMSVRTDSRGLREFCVCAKELGFGHLSAVSVTDFIGEGEYEILYFLWSYQDGLALTVKTRIGREEPSIDSVSDIWGEAQIHERELHELFGVEFVGNADLSELFLEGWNQTPPFRKDFDWREYVRSRYYRNEGRERGYFEVEK